MKFINTPATLSYDLTCNISPEHLRNYVDVNGCNLLDNAGVYCPGENEQTHLMQITLDFNLSYTAKIPLLS